MTEGKRPPVVAGAAYWLVLAMLISGSLRAAPLTTHASLDWRAPYRWVHVDNVAPERGDVFEAARAGWLRDLRQGDSLLADGRPLFWGHRADKHSKEQSAYFTFYPFRRYADLDARREAVRATQAVVGKDALARYDSCDSVLVEPHFSEIWRRSPDDDYVPAGTDSLTELSAACGRMEFRTPTFSGGGELDSLWKELRAGLAEARFPLTCLVFQNVYGPSKAICIWLAGDAATLRTAPPLVEVMTRKMGAERSRIFLERLDALFPVSSVLEVERRTEMSNLGK